MPHLNEILKQKRMYPTLDRAKEELIIAPSSTSKLSLSEKIAILRSKYMLNAELERDIVQVIVEEIGQGLRPKV